MKYSIPISIVYCICFLKIVSTFLYLSMPEFDYYFLTIVALPACLSGAYHKEIAWLCLVIITITIMLWLSGVVLTFIGIRYKKMRKASIVIFTIATIIDLLTVFISPNIMIIFSCSIVSILTLFLCTICLTNKKSSARKNCEKT